MSPGTGLQAFRSAGIRRPAGSSGCLAVQCGERKSEPDGGDQPTALGSRGRYAGLPARRLRVLRRSMGPVMNGRSAVRG
jgi:hypothetical protein